MTLFRCTACGKTVFPARLVCHVCGGGVWAAVEVGSGEVESATIVRHQVDGGGGAPVHIACVRTGPGVRLLVRLPVAPSMGRTVLLTESGGAVLAQAEPLADDPP